MHICMHIHLQHIACTIIVVMQIQKDYWRLSKNRAIKKAGGVRLCRLKNQVTIQFHDIKAQQKICIYLIDTPRNLR